MLPFLFTLFILILSIPSQSLILGWSRQDPYQYIQTSEDGAAVPTVTGLDIELAKKIITKISYQEIPWEEREKALKTGRVDFILGSPKTKEFTVSKAYRTEEDAFFTHSDDPLPSSGFIDSFRKTPFKIGVVKGYLYVNPEIQNLIHNPAYQDYIVWTNGDDDNLEKLFAKEIQGFLSSRLSGTTAAWRIEKVEKIHSLSVGKPQDVHIVFRPGAITAEQLTHFNKKITTLIDQGGYDKLVSWYLYPLILSAIMETPWFHWIELWGVVAFAFTGIMDSRKRKLSPVGVFIFCLVPGFASIILRDLVIGLHPISVFQSPLYVELVALIAIIYLATQRYFKNISNHKWYIPLYNACMGLGISTLAVNGVIVALITKAAPMWIWGPFFAFLTSVAGIIYADVISFKRSEVMFGRKIYSEIALVWGAILSMVLVYETHYVNLDIICATVMASVFGSWLTCILVDRYQIYWPNFCRPKESL